MRTGSVNGSFASPLPAPALSGAFTSPPPGVPADTYAAVHGDKPDGLPTLTDGLAALALTDAVVRSAHPAWTEVEDL